jgi:DNA modification methylase
MQAIEIAKVVVAERQRQKIGGKDLQDLKDSIRQIGLIQAPVLTASHQLVVGERRLRAMTELHQEGHQFTYTGQPVPVDHIPFTAIEDLDFAALSEIEFAENIFRVDLSWQEKTLAQQKLHLLRKADNPKQSVSETAREIETRTGGEQNRNTVRLELARSMIVADHLHDPEVQRARSADEALKIILDRAETKIKIQGVQDAIGTSSLHRVILGDCREVMKKMPAGQVDTILVDPPYGMNADKMGKGEFHMYDDSPEEALSVCKFIISEGFRLTKPKATMFLFCDVDHFITLRTFAQQQAWTCWRHPIIWRKGTDGHSPWGRAGFIRTTEFILFAVKGQRELIYPGGPDVLDFKRPGRAERIHSAEKPVDLLAYLIHLSTLPGQHVLDPCGGSGPVLDAASREKVKATVIEKEESYYNECLGRLEKASREPAPFNPLDD